MMKTSNNFKAFSNFVFLIFILIACDKNVRKKEEKETELKTILKKHKKSPIDSFRIQLTKDNIPDYLVFDESDYNSSILFFDGKTGKEIKYNHSITSDFSDFDSIKFDCKQSKNALAFEIGNVNDFYQINVLNYDIKTDSIQEIFKYPLVNIETKQIRFVKLSNCNDTIMVYNGKVVGDKVYPKNSKILEVYVYNSHINKFEKK